MSLVWLSLVQLLGNGDFLSRGDSSERIRRADDPAFRPPDAVSPLIGPLSLSIASYQKAVGRIKGIRCPMEPSCSAYARNACARLGALRGTLLAVDRINRCGHDLRFYGSWRDRDGFHFIDAVPHR